MRWSPHGVADEAGAVLNDQQRADLATTGVTRLPGAVDRATADAMADAVWASLARRGVDREDRSTWPVGMPSKLQDLRKHGTFDAFDTPRVRSAVDELVGHTAWAPESWGALVTFPQPGPWVLPHKTWHLDLPGRAPTAAGLGVARLFGLATDVVPQGGGTLVVEGSHEVVRRMVAAAPGLDIGGSAEVRKRLTAAHPWFRALQREGGDRIRQFMVDGDEVDGVRVRVAELTGAAGDVVVMLPWTVHNIAMNVAEVPRCMATRTRYGDGALELLYGSAQATGSDATP